MAFIFLQSGITDITVVISPETGKVLERQVDRPDHSASGTEVSKLVALSLTAGHAATIRPHADAPLHFD